MPEYEIIHKFSNVGDRNEVRMRVVDELSLEVPGSGKKNLASRYTYYVEELSDGKRIYLRRPANLHNGFDFLVCVEDINFNEKGKRRNYPKHDDIVFDLLDKKMENRTEFDKLLSHLEELFFCEKEINYKVLNSFSFDAGFSCELIAGVLKWLFIEQDIRYWNYSGREMLWAGIIDISR